MTQYILCFALETAVYLKVIVLHTKCLLNTIHQQSSSNWTEGPECGGITNGELVEYTEVLDVKWNNCTHWQAFFAQSSMHIGQSFDIPGWFMQQAKDVCVYMVPWKNGSPGGVIVCMYTCVHVYVCACARVRVCVSTCTITINRTFCPCKCTCAILLLNFCVTKSPHLNCFLFRAQKWLSAAPLWSASFPDRWLNGQIEKSGVKTIGHVSLIGKMEEKMCKCMYVCELARAPLCVYVQLREADRQGGGGGLLSLSVYCVLCEGGREAVSDTLVCSLLAPLWGRSTQASPGESGGPLGTGQDREGERGQHGGQAFSHYEKERNQIQAKSPSIYCIPHLSRASSWKEIHEGNCTMGPGRTREDRRGEEICT